MIIYSDPKSAYSHQVRLALAEKGIIAEVVNVDPQALPEDFDAMSADDTPPMLVDRELKVCRPLIIMEYLDERFPHPPLMPIDPVARAQARLYLYRLDQDWYRPMEHIMSANTQVAASARKELRDSLLDSIPIFGAKPFFMSDELSLVDCVVVPVLWRLTWLGIDLPVQARAIKQYAARMFMREAFRRSLSYLEEEMYASVA